MTAAPAEQIRRGVAYLKSRLAKPVTVAGRPQLALAETAQPFQDSQWFWTDDNSKALELLALPAIRNGDPAFVDAILDFVVAMSPDATIRRRLAAPQLQLRNPDPRDFLVLTPFHALSGDLSRGVVRQAVRFNDGRGHVAAVHTGNLVEFRLGLHRHCLDVEDGITGYGVTRTADGVTLFHDTLLEVPGLLGRGRRRVGQLRYVYEVSADQPGLRLRVALRTEPGIALRDVRITTACDQMSGSPRTLRLGRAGAWDTPPLPAGSNVKLRRGPVDHLVLQEAGLTGFAHVLHIRPTVPDQVFSVTAAIPTAGLPHWLLTRYATPALAAGESFAIAEDRLLLSGGRPDEAADIARQMQDPASLSGIDPSASYDHGAELNAVASYLLQAATSAYTPAVPPERQAVLRAWFDRHLDGFFASLAPSGAPDGSAVYVRGLAFVVLALDGMQQATGDTRYGVRLGAALDLLLQAQQDGVNDGVFRDTGAEAAYLDCQGAAILALARLLRAGGDGRVAPALHRALDALRLGTLQVDMGGGATVPYDTIVVRSQARDGRWMEDGAFWTFKAALLLRGLREALAAHAAGRLNLTDGALLRAESMERLCEARLAETARERPDGIEHLTSPAAGETNSETQPWVLLAIAAPQPRRAMLRMASD